MIYKQIKEPLIRRRLCDFEGTWKVQSRVGAAGYFDACGLPESMKSEMMTAVETMKIKRLAGGKVGPP